MLHGLPDGLIKHTNRVAAPKSETKLQFRRCAVCGYTRKDAPSAFSDCCGKKMEVVGEPADGSRRRTYPGAGQWF